MENRSRILTAPLFYSFVCFMLGLLMFAGYDKILVLLSAILAVFLLFKADLQRIRTFPAVLLFFYIVWSGFTVFHAISGKFFLREYSKIFLAGLLFLCVLCYGKKTAEFGKWTAEVLAGLAALYGLCSVESASTGVFQEAAAFFLPHLGTVDMGFETGTRLVGILGNANVMASILALGIFCSVALLSTAEKKKERIWGSVYGAVSAYAFLLCFSMGAIVCFFISCLLGLIYAGKLLGRYFIQMFFVFFPSLVMGFFAFPWFDKTGDGRMIPLLFLLTNVMLVLAMELLLAEKLEDLLKRHMKLMVSVPAVLLVLGVLYLVTASRLCGEYEFGGELRRSAYPKSGEHQLQVTADGEVQVSIASQTRVQTMMHTETELYQGTAGMVEFTVPKGSVVCYFTFESEPGVRLQSAILDGRNALKLSYLLLPDSVANRIQGLLANQNVVQRMVFYQDGMKLFWKHPWIGNGVGSFETAVTSVQDFYYETKYIHNHYIQVLEEDGIFGFLVYVLSLTAMLSLLVRRWKREVHREVQEELAYLFPSFTAAFFMIVLHSAFEISLSSVTFLCMSYSIFGLIILFMGEQKQDCTQKENLITKRQAIWLLRIIKIVRGFAMALAGCFAISLAGNLYAGWLMKRPVETTETYFQNARFAEKIDIYEKNDILLSYLYMVVQFQAADQLSQANAYAARLMKVQSNAIPAVLEAYYLQTGQFEEAVRAAMAGAVCSSSDPAVWNLCVSLLRQMFMEWENSPLVTDGENLIPLLAEYAAMWRERNETALEPLELEEENQAFFYFIEKMQDE